MRRRHPSYARNAACRAWGAARRRHICGAACSGNGGILPRTRRHRPCGAGRPRIWSWP